MDVINADCALDGYDLVIAPMLYMVRDGFAERVDAFVKRGGQFVTTYWSGIVNETDLCHLGGFPGPLRPVLGIWAEEIDGLYDEERNAVSGLAGNEAGLCGPYEVTHLCDLIHLEGARALASYDGDFYAGRPAVTVNEHGTGRAYYVASRNDLAFQRDFFGHLIETLALPRALPALPEGVTAQCRSDGEQEFVFVQNFANAERLVTLPGGHSDMVSGEALSDSLVLPPFGCRVLRRAR